jgi:hypothetical protein
MRTILTLLLLAAYSHASATSCDAVSRKLTDAQRVAWASVLANQLSVSSVSVSQSFTLADWHIVYVDTPNTDSAFLFFHGDPISTHFVTLWAGAARIQEEGSIKTWVVKNASGIPAPLATCFAWYVSNVLNR